LLPSDAPCCRQTMPSTLTAADCTCLGAKVAGSYSTTASGSCNTQSLLFICSCARRFRLAKASAACANILEVIVIICLQIVPLPAANANSVLVPDAIINGSPAKQTSSGTKVSVPIRKTRPLRSPRPDQGPRNEDLSPACNQDCHRHSGTRGRKQRA
jgi:hypothetical protein